MQDTKTIVKFWGILSLFILGFYLISIGFSAILMIFLSLFIAVVLHRPTTKLTIYTNSRTLSATILVFGVVILLILSIMFIIPFFVTQIQELTKTLPTTFSDLNVNDNFVSRFLESIGIGGIYSSLITNIQSSINTILGGIAGQAFSTFSTFFSGLVNCFIIIMMTFFALIEGPQLFKEIWNFFDKGDGRENRYKHIVTKGVDGVAGYIYGVVLIGVINALSGMIIIFALSFFIDIPKIIFVPVGLILFLSSFIPMIGTIVAVLISGLLILLYNPLAALIYILVFGALQIVINNAFVPKIFEKTVNISPLITLISMTIGGALLGIIGLLVCVPIAYIIKICLKEYSYAKKPIPTEE